MMTENLELLEKTIYQIKALIKEPDFFSFEQVKARTCEQLRIQQAAMNPKRPNTQQMNAAIGKKN